ncbi:MAG: M1 family aminopeptidase [Bryobacteraceae bacterium]|jgi:aminopeptidase N
MSKRSRPGGRERTRASAPPWLGWFAPAMAAALMAPALAEPLPRLYRVEHYDVRITLDPAAGRLTGDAVIRFESITENLVSLDLDAGGLTVSSVEEAGKPDYFERQGEHLIVVLNAPANPGEPRALAIHYQAASSKGVEITATEASAGYFASHWMPVNDRVENPAALALVIAAPAAWKTAASGELVSEHTEGGYAVTAWSVDGPPQPPFLYAFASGPFEERKAVIKQTGAPAVTLRILGGADVLVQTKAALEFFAGCTGRTYPRDSYTQVFASGQTGQEAVGLTLLPESYAKDLAAKPQDLWLLAHELAHQWYGIGIPIRNWSDFWLSEGLATYLADVFLERQYGRQRYQTEIDRSRKIYEDLKSKGKDRPLSFHDWTTPDQAGGSLPYHKGAAFLALLRTALGDDLFWNHLKAYTRDNWGKRVTSEDFQKAMEKGLVKKAQQREVSKLFDAWVFGQP